MEQTKAEIHLYRGTVDMFPSSVHNRAGINTGPPDG
jgi:hypothetical protein